MKILSIFLFAFWLQFCASPPPQNPGDEYDNIIKICFNDPCFISILQTAISSASKSIDLSLYSFTDERVTPLLNNAISKGVQVRAVSEYDSEKQAGFQNLIRQNIPVIFGNSSGIMHNKYIIIDKKFLITGSTNLTKTMNINFNHMLLIRSEKLCSIYSRDFENQFTYRLFSTQKNALAVFNPIENTSTSVGKFKISPYFTPYSNFYPSKTYSDPENPGQNLVYQNIFNRILPYLENAEKSINILAYSLTDPIFISTLKSASLRKITIKILIDQSQFLSSSNQTQSQLLDLGNLALVKICQPPHEGLLHHKAIWIDHKILMAGSFNFSQNASQSNDENFLIIENADSLTESFDKEMDQITPYCKNIKDFIP